MSERDRLLHALIDATPSEWLPPPNVLSGMLDRLIAAGATMPTPELPVTITTAEQLDALPFLTVIREVRPPRRGIDYGGISAHHPNPHANPQRSNNGTDKTTLARLQT